jgi:hypothetical protein
MMVIDLDLFSHLLSPMVASKSSNELGDSQESNISKVVDEQMQDQQCILLGTIITQ